MGEAKVKLEAKKKKFEESPERFIDRDEVVFAVMSENSGVLQYDINPSKSDMYGVALGELILELPMRKQFAKVQAMKANNESKNRILTPGGDNGKIINPE